MAAQALAGTGRYDAIVALGAVMRGATYHIDVIAGESAAGLTRVTHETGVVVTNGIITVEGVSLTVVQPTVDTFSVAIIPHTAAVTTLGTKRPGDLVNIEVDVLAKYVERLLAYDTQLPRGGDHQGVNS